MQPGPKTGIIFSHSRALYAFGAGQDVEPNARVDYQGNAYVGGIRGLTGGNDLWRFDLNPKSATYDPFLLGANPVWRADGSVSNLAWKGQPDALAPSADRRRCCRRPPRPCRPRRHRVLLPSGPRRRRQQGSARRGGSSADPDDDAGRVRHVRRGERPESDRKSLSGL